MAEPRKVGIFVAHPPGFRRRRGLNWAFIGLLYTSFYMCRYNLPLAGGAIRSEFGFSRAQLGTIITTQLLAYACGQIINGLLTDRLGGKRAMLIGATGTIVMNILFGVASFWGLLSLFIVIRGIDGYLQAFGSPGMVKINAAWFRHTERGSFAGIFGFMINLGRFGINNLGAALLAGFIFLGLIRIPPLHWRWLFWVPAGIALVIGTCMALIVKDTPEEAHFPPVNPHEEIGGRVQVKMADVFKIIASNPVVWIIACAQFLAFSIPLVASAGSLISGFISDKIFHGRRAPVAAVLYFLETLVILSAAQFHSVNAAIFFLVLISLTANSTHSILGTAAAMDIGGAKMAGFTAGVIDSFQYFGGSLAGYFLGALLDRSWANYFYFMVPFGIIGGVLMLSILGRVTWAKQP